MLHGNVDCYRFRAVLKSLLLADTPEDGHRFFKAMSYGPFGFLVAKSTKIAAQAHMGLGL